VAYELENAEAYMAAAFPWRNIIKRETPESLAGNGLHELQRSPKSRFLLFTKFKRWQWS